MTIKSIEIYGSPAELIMNAAPDRWDAMPAETQEFLEHVANFESMAFAWINENVYVYDTIDGTVYGDPMEVLEFVDNCIMIANGEE